MWESVEGGGGRVKRGVVVGLREGKGERGVLEREVVSVCSIYKYSYKHSRLGALVS